MNKHNFDATLELEMVRTYTKICRRKSYQRSRLTKYRSELVQLKEAGASYRELMIWLRKNKRVKMAHTSVMRYLKNLPELKESQDA